MEQRRSAYKLFGRYAWFALAWNIVVILWGVFLRASKSGDGCGRFWLTCGGEIVPSAPELKTLIEFSHRIMSAIDGFVVLVLVVWAVVLMRRDRTPKSRLTAVFAFGSLVFVITEAAVGAGLVLTGNTAETLTAARPFWMAGHLVNTFILLGFLSLTAWTAGHERPMKRRVSARVRLGAAIAVAALLVVGTSGSIAALASMLFPSATLGEGIAKDFAAGSNILLRLRLIHPVSSILAAGYLIFFSRWLRARAPGDAYVAVWSQRLSLLLIVQLGFGALTFLTLAPIVMQVGHLLLADLIWICFVLLMASFACRKTIDNAA